MKLGEKFSISCRKENFVEVQRLLFSNGYFWNGENKTNIISNDIFEEYDIIHLSNYGNGEFSGNWVIGLCIVNILMRMIMLLFIVIYNCFVGLSWRIWGSRL